MTAFDDYVDAIGEGDIDKWFGALGEMFAVDRRPWWQRFYGRHKPSWLRTWGIIAHRRQFLKLRAGWRAWVPICPDCNHGWASGRVYCRPCTNRRYPP